MKIILEVNERNINALCKTYNRPEQVQGEKGEMVDNPVSPEDFARDRAAKWIDEVSDAYDVNQAVELARKGAVEGAKKEIKASYEVNSII